MKRACCIFVVFLLVFPLISAIDPDDPNPYLNSQAASQNLAPDIAKALASMEERLAEDFHDFNDENFGLMDARVTQYIADVSRSTQIKAIVGVLGLNLVVAGIAFYWLNKQNRKISYESADQRKRQSADDRHYIVENLNHIRDRLDYLEEQSKLRVDTTVIPTEDLDRSYQNKMDYERVEQEDFDRNLNKFVNSHGGVDDGGRQEETYGNYMEGQAPAETYSDAGAEEFYPGFERQRAEERFI